MCEDANEDCCANRKAKLLMNWVRVWNKLWTIIDRQGVTYFGGPRFLGKIREVDSSFYDYGQYMDLLRQQGHSTSRKDYFYRLLNGLDPTSRIHVLMSILEDIAPFAAEEAAGLRDMLNVGVGAPLAVVPQKAWNADRLNTFLAQIDEAIGKAEYERSVTLAYTCLEGFYGAFVEAKIPGQTRPNEIIALARWIKDHLKKSLPSYPDEVLNLVTQTSHAVDRSRNRFSEAHFGGEAGRWLAIYMRDLVNTQIRLLLHFMP